MNGVLIILIVLLIGGFYLYHKATKRRLDLRQKARNNYDDIKASIGLWATDRENPDKIMLALAALEIYETWHKRAALLPITYQQTTPDGFELIDEWRKILGEEELAATDWASTRPGASAALAFREHLTALRGLRQNGQ